MPLTKSTVRTDKKNGQTIISYKLPILGTLLSGLFWFIIVVIAFNIDVNAGEEFNQPMRIWLLVPAIPSFIYCIYSLLMSHRIILGDNTIVIQEHPINLKASRRFLIKDVVGAISVERRKARIIEHSSHESTYAVNLLTSDGYKVVTKDLGKSTTTEIVRQILSFKYERNVQAVNFSAGLKGKKLDKANKPAGIQIDEADEATVICWRQPSNYVARVYDWVFPNFAGFALAFLLSFFVFSYIGLDFSMIALAGAVIMMIIVISLLILLNLDSQQEITLGSDSIILSEKLIFKIKREIKIEQIDLFATFPIIKGGHHRGVDVYGVSGSDLVMYSLLRVNQEDISEYVQAILQSHIAKSKTDTQ